jgi:hypothetical protein
MSATIRLANLKVASDVVRFVRGVSVPPMAANFMAEIALVQLKTGSF